MANRTKYVVTIHDLGVEFLPNYHKFPQNLYLDFASKYASRHADALIAVSTSTKSDLGKRYNVAGGKVFVVHEGVDTAVFKPQSKSKGSRSLSGSDSVKRKYKIGGDYILYVGTVQPRKNLEFLVKVFAKMNVSGPVSSFLPASARLITKAGKTVNSSSLRAVGNPSTTATRKISLIIVGKLGWDYQQILDAPKKYGVGDRVKFLGYVASEDLPALYSGCAVFAFPSLFEGFGLPILEALACGAKVIASDIAPHREIYEKIFHFPGSNYHLSNNLSIKKSKIYGKWPMTDGKFKLGVPMVLAKVNDIDQWSKFLYQSITKYEKRLSNKSQFKRIKAEFSWLACARETIAVFERTWGVDGDNLGK